MGANADRFVKSLRHSKGLIGGWWADSNIRIPFQQVALRMLESQDRQQVYVSSGVLDLTPAESANPLHQERKRRCILAALSRTSGDQAPMATRVSLPPRPTSSA
jgi:hypothetical protein